MKIATPAAIALATTIGALGLATTDARAACAVFSTSFANDGSAMNDLNIKGQAEALQHFMRIAREAPDLTMANIAFEESAETLACTMNTCTYEIPYCINR